MIQRLGIFLIGLLVLAYVGLSLWSIQETRDAETVDAVQVTLQRTLSKGMSALQLPPGQILPANVVNAARTSFPKGVTMDKSLHLVIVRSGREAQYEITAKGDLRLKTLKKFTRFHVENGRIVRSNRWIISLPSAIHQEGVSNY